ncbi:MFS transporter [Teichococcus vastitatis]|uniref:MFS transporter n=1 Tax=Teichococcus vastitatis TaxID=2307076 RepID=A0ABS9W1A4_9PROT|nr:MFS transporter [Pseudoroseomonas vastitatis]MCI0753076.1 MFS transporter [Pseudoroseomonas vastitatis]
MKGGGNLVAAAFALTALSYGLARFGYGLLLPQIREDLPLGAVAAGWVSGGAFAAYCVGIVAASLLGARLGARMMAVLAGLTATLGVGLVALAPSTSVLGAAIALAGLSTGFTSPPLAAAVAQGFDGPARPKANGMINSGTAAGIVFSGIVAMVVGTAWRELYALFALIGGLITIWLWFALPAGSPVRRNDAGISQDLARPGLAGLCVAGFLMGVSSTAVWTFGAHILRSVLSFPEANIPVAWIALGLGGLAGSSTGMLVARFGIGSIHQAALFGIALCYGILAAATVAPLLAFAAMGLFGVAYIVSSGVLLIRGIALLPDRPELGLGIPFLAVASGQTVGAPLFGAVLDGAGPWAALLLFGAVTCGAMFERMQDVASPPLS